MALLKDSLCICSASSPPPPLAVTDKAQALQRRAATRRIRLSAGEPDCDTPDNIKKAAIKAIESGRASKYTHTAVEELGGAQDHDRQQVRSARTTSTTKPNQITSFRPAASRVLYNTRLMVALNPGDEVIIPAPYWVSYPT